MLLKNKKRKKSKVLLLLPLLWIFLCGQCGCRRNAPKVIKFIPFFKNYFKNSWYLNYFGIFAMNSWKFWCAQSGQPAPHLKEEEEEGRDQRQRYDDHQRARVSTLIFLRRGWCIWWRKERRGRNRISRGLLQGPWHRPSTWNQASKWWRWNYQVYRENGHCGKIFLQRERFPYSHIFISIHKAPLVVICLWRPKISLWS